MVITPFTGNWRWRSGEVIKKPSPHKGEGLEGKPSLTVPKRGEQTVKRLQAGFLASGSSYSPSLPAPWRQWHPSTFVPVTVARPRRIFTAFPVRCDYRPQPPEIIKTKLTTYKTIISQTFSDVKTLAGKSGYRSFPDVPKYLIKLDTASASKYAKIPWKFEKNRGDHPKYRRFCLTFPSIFYSIPAFCGGRAGRSPPVCRINFVTP